MRVEAARQVLGIMCTCQVVQLMGYDFSVDIYYNFSNIFFHLCLLFNRKGLNTLVLRFSIRFFFKEYPDSLKIKVKCIRQTDV